MPDAVERLDQACDARSLNAVADIGLHAAQLQPGCATRPLKNSCMTDCARAWMVIPIQRNFTNFLRQPSRGTALCVMGSGHVFPPCTILNNIQKPLPKGGPAKNGDGFGYFKMLLQLH